MPTQFLRNASAAALALVLATPVLAQDAPAAAETVTETATAAAVEDQALVYPDWAQTETQRKGYAIAVRADGSDNGFGSSAVSAQMILRNAAGRESTREMQFTTLERVDETVGDKSLVVFNTPRDVEGTALLSHAQLIEQDDQWLYLPALKRVRRISSSNKSGPFLGSEFAFEDFTALELGKYTYDYIEDTTIEQEGASYAVHVVDRFAAYEDSGYSRQRSYVDQDNDQIRRVEFFDRRGDALKTLDLLDLRDYGNGIWRAQLLRMVNQKTGKSTDIVYADYDFGVDLDDGDFVPGVLERGR